MYSTGFSPPISSRTSRKRSRRDERVARKQGIQMTTLLIAGATGLVGGHALKLALADERVDHVIALTRRPRTEERRVGTESVSRCRYRGTRYHEKKTNKTV